MGDGCLQVTVFKEDFDQERRDREASRVSMEHLDTKLRETNIELASTKKKVWHTFNCISIHGHECRLLELYVV